MTKLHLYFFSLYCQGNGFTKSYAFATIQMSETDAIKAALNKAKRDFPSEQGWYGHQVSFGVIPEEMIIALSESYTAIDTGPRATD